METSPSKHPARQTFNRIMMITTAAALLGWGCSTGVAPSRTASGAGVGAAGGAAVGAVAGSSSSMGTATGMLGGAAAGAIIGGVVGLAQDMKDRKEQDRLAQERAYQQELARAREAEAKLKQKMDEELAVAQGFRISDTELNEAQRLLDAATQRHNRLLEERAAAIAKKNALDEAQARLMTTEADIARLEEELARLRGDDGTAVPNEDSATGSAGSNTPPSAYASPSSGTP